MPTATARFCFTAIAALCFSTAALAQMPAYTKAGPLPPALAKANTIFVSNGGSDSPVFPQPYSGDSDRPYSEFFAALKSTGDFTLVADPAQADLVLEIHLVEYSQNATAFHYPMFRLVIYDAKSHYILWTITRSIDAAARKSTFDKNFEDALGDVLNQFLQVTGKAPAAAH